MREWGKGRMGDSISHSPIPPLSHSKPPDVVARATRLPVAVVVPLRRRLPDHTAVVGVHSLSGVPLIVFRGDLDRLRRRVHPLELARLQVAVVDATVLRAVVL